MASDFAITFRISDAQFPRLQAAFNALRLAKREGAGPDADDPGWRRFFNDEELATFWSPSPEEAEAASARWFATPIPQRFTDRSLVTRWHFESMIDAFRNGEYDLISCTRIAGDDPSVGELAYDPHAWPFGGTGCMRALIEAFRGIVISESPDLRA
ncbi:MAG: hypothetical protein Q8O67_05610 [Deltaproteobacteria bacterium]|nr:hypothetical protein [Deltaproteobacteria bacterium]